MIRVAPFKLEAYLTARGGDPLRALLGLAAGDCIDAGIDGMAGVGLGAVVAGLERVIRYIWLRK